MSVRITVFLEKRIGSRSWIILDQVDLSPIQVLFISRKVARKISKFQLGKNHGCFSIQVTVVHVNRGKSLNS